VAVQSGCCNILGDPEIASSPWHFHTLPSWDIEHSSGNFLGVREQNWSLHTNKSIQSRAGHVVALPSFQAWLRSVAHSAVFSDKKVPQGRDQAAKLPLFVRTQTHSLGKLQQSPVRTLFPPIKYCKRCSVPVDVEENEAKNDAVYPSLPYS